MSQQPQVEIQRIFIKDVSFEAPNTPHTFTEEWKPEVSLNLDTKSDRLQANLYDVTIAITATVTSNKKTAFLVEVHQAGIFYLEGFAGEELHHMLGSFCPTILFPYAREVVSDIVTRGGFPQLILAPVNFEALYLKHQEQQQQHGKPDAETTIN